MTKLANPQTYNCTHRLYYIDIQPITDENNKPLKDDYMYPIIKEIPVRSTLLSDDGSKMVINGGGRPGAPEVILPASYEGKSHAEIEYMIEHGEIVLKHQQMIDAFINTMTDKDREIRKELSKVEKAFEFLESMKNAQLEGRKENSKYHDKK